MKNFYEQIIAPEAEELDELLKAFDIPYIELDDCAHTKTYVECETLVCDSCDEILEDYVLNRMIEEENKLIRNYL